MANFWKRLAGKIQYGEYYKLIKPEIGKLFKKYKSKGKRVVIWGAGLKGNAFLSVTDPEARYVEAVIDRNESLYGTRLVSGHLVVDVSYVIENPVDIVFIMSGVQYVDNYFLLSKSGFKGQVFDMDYLVKNISAGNRFIIIILRKWILMTINYLVTQCLKSSKNYLKF